MLQIPNKLSAPVLELWPPPLPPLHFKLLQGGGQASGQAHSLSNGLFLTCWPSRKASESHLTKMSACHDPWGLPQRTGNLNYLMYKHQETAILHKNLI